MPSKAQARKVGAADLPTPEVMDAIAGIGVDDEDGAQRPLEGLVRHGKTAIVFIRHFHCNLCQAYIEQLASSIRPQALSAKQTKLIVIGCGHWSTIKPYKELTHCPFTFYADPTKKLYDELGMKRTFIADTGPNDFKASYGKSFIGSTIESISNMWKMGKFVNDGGHFGQLGGEFVFQDGKCIFAHRMQHTRDHVPVAELAERLGVQTTS